MSNIVFLIGHPASGKTTLYSAIEQKFIQGGITARRVSDREIFLETAKIDSEQRFHFKKPEGTLQITDPKYYELHFHLFKNVLNSTQWQEDWIFVELTSPDYSKALKQFGEDFLANCYLILLVVSLQTSLSRNQKRHPIPTKDIDAYRIPEDYIIECYAQEFGIENLLPFFKDSIVIHNDKDNLPAIPIHVSKVLRFLQV